MNKIILILISLYSFSAFASGYTCEYIGAGRTRIFDKNGDKVKDIVKNKSDYKDAYNEYCEDKSAEIEKQKEKDSVNCVSAYATCIKHAKGIDSSPNYKFCMWRNGCSDYSHNANSAKPDVLRLLSESESLHCPQGQGCNADSACEDLCSSGFYYDSAVGSCSKLCEANEVFLNGQCSTCSGGRVVVNGSCECPEGQLFVNGQCKVSCLESEIEVGDTCVACSGGKVPVNNQCKCPSGSVEIGGVCENVCSSTYWDRFWCGPQPAGYSVIGQTHSSTVYAEGSSCSPGYMLLVNEPKLAWRWKCGSLPSDPTLECGYNTAGNMGYYCWPKN